MSTFLFALNAILPIIILVCIGYFLKSIKLFTDDFFKQANKLCFKLFLPITLFMNIYSIESVGDISLKAPLFAVCGIIGAFILGFIVSKIFVKNDAQKGATWQCVFRSNYAIIGIPLAELILGQEAGQVAAVLSAFVIPTFNILAIIALSVYNDKGEKPSVKKILIGICKNPLIIGVVLGILALLIRMLLAHLGSDFRITNIDFINKSLTYLKNCTTPIALIVLGGQFEFKSFKKFKIPVIVATVTRSFIVPITAILLAGYAFGFRGAEIVAFVSVFGSPVAVSSAIMAREMNSDGELAGALVVSTTIVSVVSLTILIAMIKALGFI